MHCHTPLERCTVPLVIPTSQRHALNHPLDSVTRAMRDYSSHTNAPKRPERPRQRSPETPREAQTGPERPREAKREAQRGPVRPRDPEKPREAQRGPQGPLVASGQISLDLIIKVIQF